MESEKYTKFHENLMSVMSMLLDEMTGCKKRLSISISLSDPAASVNEMRNIILGLKLTPQVKEYFSECEKYAHAIHDDISGDVSFRSENILVDLEGVFQAMELMRQVSSVMTEYRDLISVIKQIVFDPIHSDAVKVEKISSLIR